MREALKVTAAEPSKLCAVAVISPPEIEKFLALVITSALPAMPSNRPENWPLASRLTYVLAVFELVAAST